MCANHSTSTHVFTHLRHRWEMPLIWLSFLITAAAFIIGVCLSLIHLLGGLEPLVGAESAAEIASNAYLVLLLPLAPIAFYAFRFYMAAQARANALLVGPDQFPKLFALFQDLARRLEMPTPPSLYVTNGNGVVNAYALECNRRYNYVVIHSEIAMLLPTSPDTVEFVLAHELAHHKLRHVSLWRVIVGLIPNALVIPGLATTRAQEYSADRVALAICPNISSAVRLLVAGPWMEKGVNPDAWLKQCEAEHGEWLVRLSNTLSSHAVGVKRYKALRDIERNGFESQGEMF
jgi:Zn-dependent protease with chaperone function